MKAISHLLCMGAVALVLASFSTGLRAAEPLVTVTILEPLEGGALIYAPMGALTANDPPTGRLWFKLRIQNDGPALTLTSIRVIGTDVDVSIPKNVPCPAGATTVELKASDNPDLDEVITLTNPAPGTVTIRLYFAENLTPKLVQHSLVPYVPAVPGGQYLYPADEGDIGPNEYFSAGGAVDSHLANASQGWGADWKVYRIISQGNSSTVRAGGDASVNEDRLGWGVPIRAIADGVVLRTSTGWIDNPRPGDRAFQLMAEYDGEAISDVKVKRLGPTTTPGVQRAASLVRLPDNTFKITIWDIADHGRVITRLGSSVPDPAELVTAIALEKVSATRLVTSVRLVNGMHRFIVWNVSTDGQSVTNFGHANDIAVTEVSLAPLSSTRVASGVRTAAGDLRVAVFSVGSSPGVLSEDSAGAATSICTTKISDTRFASSLRADDGRLKVIVWDFLNNTLDRRGDATAENISRVAATVNSGGKWVTAMRTSPGGLLQLARWSASEDGMTLMAELVTTTTQAIENTALAIAPGSEKGNSGTYHAATASVIVGGVFKINLWGEANSLPGTYKYSGENTAGAVSQVSLDELTDLEYFAAARTTGGALKITTWHWADGGGNSVYVLHGNCRVSYHHFQENSVNTDVLYPGAPVAAGQILGRMGNSGSAGGPHTHIDSERLEDGHLIQEWIDDEAQLALTGVRSLTIIGQRPMPFSGARAMRLSLISPGGEGNPANAFSTMNGHGMYDVSLGIRPRLNTRYVDPTIIYQAPTGRKEPVPGFPVTGGPMPTPGLALGVVPSGGRLYIRGRSYNEAITFSTPMTVRRYDYYRTGGSVIIGR
jgi:hypothetical protein